MNSHYEVLGVSRAASPGEIKKAFRDKAKKLHPDIAGKTAEAQMRKLLAAYEALSSEERRGEHDHFSDRCGGPYRSRFAKERGFNYREWLYEQSDDPAVQAKLILFELLNLKEDAAIAVWRRSGGLNFPMEKYVSRGDWLDCAFILAEELDKRGQHYEAFKLLARVIDEERRCPYFRHFTPEIEKLLREIVRLRLRPLLDEKTWAECVELFSRLEAPDDPLKKRRAN